MRKSKLEVGKREHRLPALGSDPISDWIMSLLLLDHGVQNAEWLRVCQSQHLAHPDYFFHSRTGS